jgi:Double-stranded RNA binding motif
MSKSNKNLLQEILQKNKLPLPQYETVPIVNSKVISFQSTVLLFDQKFQGTGNNMKDAEQNCAKLAYDFLCQNKSDLFRAEKELKILKNFDVSHYHYENIDNIVFIDGENVDISLENLIDYKQTLFLVFVSKNTTKKQCFHIENHNSNCFLLVTQSMGKDSADHYLTFVFGQLSIILNHQKINYYLISRDHFIECLTTFMPHTINLCHTDELKTYI